ncbi:hypothetical protein GCM10010403_12170 [Glycomyces rutgersensis]|uniref:Uncharacterized protein n=1 Tax=Glycomyces rutgersensis TaxID=58115 RepID=A0ABN3F9W2_9ACTN
MVPCRQLSRSLAPPRIGAGAVFGLRPWDEALRPAYVTGRIDALCGRAHRAVSCSLGSEEENDAKFTKAPYKTETRD